jgi:hypothetical protein
MTEPSKVCSAPTESKFSPRTDKETTQATKAPVPKFASFRPRPTPQSVRGVQKDQTIEKESKEEPERTSEWRRSRDRESRRHHHHRRRSAERRQSREEDTRLTSSHDAKNSWTTKDDTSEIYVIDKKGDENNVVFGTLHRYSIPAFFRAGQGRVLGLSTDYRIDRDVSEQQVLYVKNRNDHGDQGKNKFYSKWK